MMNRPTTTTPSNLERTTRVLITGATLLLVAIGFGLLINYFYTMTALLGIVLIITYILLGPVNLMEKGINAISTISYKIPGYGKLLLKTPEANPRALAVMLVFTAFFL